MRSIARQQDASDGSKLGPRVEGVFKQLEAVDVALVDLSKSEGDARGDARARAAAALLEALRELDDVLSALDAGLLSRARQLLV